VETVLARDDYRIECVSELGQRVLGVVSKQPIEIVDVCVEEVPVDDDGIRLSRQVDPVAIRWSRSVSDDVKASCYLSCVRVTRDRADSNGRYLVHVDAADRKDLLYADTNVDQLFGDTLYICGIDYGLELVR